MIDFSKTWDDYDDIPEVALFDDSDYFWRWYNQICAQARQDKILENLRITKGNDTCNAGELQTVHAHYPIVRFDVYCVVDWVLQKIQEVVPQTEYKQ